MVITGDSGKLKVGFQLAAKFASWNLTYHQEEIGIPYAEISSTFSELNKFWITQAPLSIGLFMGKSWWVWENARLIQDGNKLSVRITGNPQTFVSF